MKKTKLSGNKRRSHIAKVFGDSFYLLIEPSIFRMATQLSSQYGGGFWTSYKTDNGGFFMIPDTKQKFLVSSLNGNMRDMSADAFGVTVCRYVYSHLSFQLTFDRHAELAEAVAEQFHLLTDYVNSHNEADAIYEICD